MLLLGRNSGPRDTLFLGTHGSATTGTTAQHGLCMTQGSGTGHERGVDGCQLNIEPRETDVCVRVPVPMYIPMLLSSGSAVPASCDSLFKSKQPGRRATSIAHHQDLAHTHPTLSPTPATHPSPVEPFKIVSNTLCSFYLKLKHFATRYGGIQHLFSKTKTNLNHPYTP